MNRMRSVRGRNPEKRMLVPEEAHRFWYRVIGLLVVGLCLFETWTSDWTAFERIGVTVVAVAVTLGVLWFTRQGSWSPKERRPRAD